MKMMLMVMLMMVGATAAFAYEPPAIIGELRDASPDSNEFGRQFCWVGDQNGDGYDDLLVAYDTYSAVRKVKMYFGGQQMDNIPDLIFGDDRIVDGFVYLGRLTPENNQWFVLSLHTFNGNTHELEFYKGGNQLDTIPDIVWSQPIDSCFGIGFGFQMYPADFNNDGFDDLAVALMDFTCNVEGPSARMILFGGAEFDSTADWINWWALPRLYMSAFGYSTCGDINKDGYDDFFDGNTLFLGGSPMDTVEVWNYQNLEGDTADGDTTNRTLHQFIMLKDVNGDGYDDWGCYWTELGVHSDQDGYYLFYGSDSPDLQPDIDLEGNHIVWDTYGQIAGGDINNDGFGDIVAFNHGGYVGDGEMHIYFGSKWMGPAASILINSSNQYGRYYATLGDIVGAFGDYNGDHICDFVAAKANGGASFRRLLVLSGSDNWKVSVPREPETNSPNSAIWSMTASPIPFNSSTNIRYSLPSSSSSSSLSLFDTNGRLVRRLSEGVQTAGDHSVTVEGLESGLYFVVLETSQGRAMRKIVCVR